MVIGGLFSGKLIKAHFAHNVAEILYISNKNRRKQDGGVFFFFSLKYFKLFLNKNVTKWKNKEFQVYLEGWNRFSQKIRDSRGGCGSLLELWEEGDWVLTLSSGQSRLLPCHPELCPLCPGTRPHKGCSLTAFTQEEAQFPKPPSLSLSQGDALSCPLHLRAPKGTEAAFGTPRLQTHLDVMPSLGGHRLHALKRPERPSVPAASVSSACWRAGRPHNDPCPFLPAPSEERRWRDPGPHREAWCPALGTGKEPPSLPGAGTWGWGVYQLVLPQIQTIPKLSGLKQQRSAHSLGVWLS